MNNTLKILLDKKYDKGFKEGKLLILKNILDELNISNANEARLTRDSVILAIKEIK